MTGANDTKSDLSERRGIPQKPKVTIVIPTYNNLLGLKKTVASIRARQCINQVEIIVVDGDSSDGTKSYLQEGHCSDLWISEPDRGVYDAINKGVKISNGNWIYVIGTGDVVLPEFDLAISHLSSRTYIYYCDVYQSRNKRRYAGKFSTVKLFHKNIPHQGMFIPREIISGSPYSLRYKILSDYAKNLELFGQKHIPFRYLPFCICYYENETGLSNSAFDTNFWNDKKAIIRANYSLVLYVAFVIYDFCCVLFLEKALMALRKYRDKYCATHHIEV